MKTDHGLIKFLASIVQRLDSAIHRINHYPVDSAISFPNTYPLDRRQLSGIRKQKNSLWSPGYQKAVAVAKERWSFTRGSNYRALPGKVLVVLIHTGGWSLTRGGRRWRFGQYTNFCQFVISVR